MERIEQKRTKTYKEVVCIASDGKESHYKDDCLIHERTLELESRPVIKNKQKGETFDGRFGYLYFIQNNEDFECLKAYLKNLEHDYEKLGPGWYISWRGDADDYNYYRLLNYQNYLSEHKRDFELVVALNDSLIKKAMTELYGKEE